MVPRHIAWFLWNQSRGPVTYETSPQEPLGWAFKAFLVAGLKAFPFRARYGSTMFNMFQAHVLCYATFLTNFSAKRLPHHQFKVFLRQDCRPLCIRLKDWWQIVAVLLSGFMLQLLWCWLFVIQQKGARLMWSLRRFHQYPRCRWNRSGLLRLLMCARGW